MFHLHSFFYPNVTKIKSVKNYGRSTAKVNKILRTIPADVAMQF